MKRYIKRTLVAFGLTACFMPVAASAACTFYWNGEWRILWEASCGELARSRLKGVEVCFTMGAMPTTQSGGAPNSIEVRQGRAWLTLQGKRAPLSEFHHIDDLVKASTSAKTANSQAGMEAEIQKLSKPLSEDEVARLSKVTGIPVQAK